MLSLLLPFPLYQGSLDVEYQEIEMLLSEMSRVVKEIRQEALQRVENRSVRLANTAVGLLIICSVVMVIPYVLYYI